MKTLARNTLLPLLLVLPFLAYFLFLAIDTTTNLPEKMLPSALISGALSMVAMAIMIFSLYRLPRSEAFIGALIGSALGVIAAFNTGGVGMMLLAFSGDGGKDGAAEILPITLSILAVLVLVPLVLGVSLGARIATSNAERREAQTRPQAGAP